jgi:hypothetical protein
VVEETVQAGDSHIVYAVDAVAHKLRRYGRFLRDRQVGSAGANEADAAKRLAGVPVYRRRTRDVMITCVGHAFVELPEDVAVDSRDQQAA